MSDSPPPSSAPAPAAPPANPAPPFTLLAELETAAQNRATLRRKIDFGNVLQALLIAAIIWLAGKGSDFVGSHTNTLQSLDRRMADIERQDVRQTERLDTGRKERLDFQTRVDQRLTAMEERMRSMETKLDSMAEAQRTDRWTFTDMDRWVRAAERGTKITLPDPGQIKQLPR